MLLVMVVRDSVRVHVLELVELVVVLDDFLVVCIENCRNNRYTSFT
jgi:hypothetical protein